MAPVATPTAGDAQAFANGTGRLSFLAEPGYAYILQFTPTLFPAVWIDVSVGTADAQGDLILEHRAHTGQGYYRLRSP